MKAAFIHGFNFDPSQPVGHPDNPRTDLYPAWATMIGHRPVHEHQYWSVPLGAKSLFKSWGHGAWNRYVYAWRLAEKEAKTLVEAIRSKNIDTIIAHSLGSRVVLMALAERGSLPVKRVLLLNGAEHTDTAAEIIQRRPGIAVMNVWTGSDDVLKWLGGWFSPRLGRVSCVGQTGVPELKAANWADLGLDMDDLQIWTSEHFPGCHLRGDNPHSFGDHLHSYEWRGNWPIYRAFLNGQLSGDDWDAIRKLGKKVES